MRGGSIFRSMSPLIFRVKELREAESMTQAQLAAKADLSVVALSRIENNHSRRVDLDTLDNLARALKVDIADLFRRVRSL
jgi:transcriptional regulator with XRE-family HTH domain